MKGYIYKLTFQDKIYYGSTTQPLKKRLHTSHFCFSRYGFIREETKSEIVDEIDFNHEKELLKLEGKYQSENECINKYINGGYINKKEYDKINYQKNKEKKMKQALEWGHKNRDRKNKRQLELHNWKKSWGGDPRYDNNLLKIAINLF